MQLQTSSLTDLENFSGLEDFQRTLSVFLRKLEVPAKDVSAVVGSVITQIPVSAFSLQLQEFLAYLEDPADISDPLADIDSRILGHKRKS